jgi:chromosome segregation ATPase
MIEEVSEALYKSQTANQEYECKYGSAPEDLRTTEEALARLRAECQALVDEHNKIPPCITKDDFKYKLKLKQKDGEINATLEVLKDAQARMKEAELEKAQCDRLEKELYDLEKKNQANVDAKRSHYEKHKEEWSREVERKRLACEKAEADTAKKDAAKKALVDFMNTKQKEIDAAAAELTNLSSCAEAQTLATARQTLLDLDRKLAKLEANEKILKKHERTLIEVKAACQYILNPSTAFNIVRICLTGNSKDIIDKSGKFVKPLNAEVDCMIGGKSYNLPNPPTFHPREIVDFIDDVYDQ